MAAVDGQGLQKGYMNNQLQPVEVLNVLPHVTQGLIKVDKFMHSHYEDHVKKSIKSYTNIIRQPHDTCFKGRQKNKFCYKKTGVFIPAYDSNFNPNLT